MPRNPKRLRHGPIDSTAETVYTVPASTRTIVRHIHVQNPGPTAATFTLSIGADGATTRIFDAVSIPANDYLDHWCYYVLEATEVMDADSSVDDLMILTIDGDEYTAG